MTGLGAVATLTRREGVRLLRQPSRLVAAVATPLLLWVLLGSGFARSFRLPGADDPSGGSYALYLLPGMLTMTVLFSSIFGAISLIEDRHEGFLQSVLVSPAPRWAVAASKLGGAALLATGQALVLLPAALILGDGVGLVPLLLVVVALACASVGIAGLGIAAAWWVDSVQGFHGVMNLVLMPMWLLSGAVFPVDGASGWLAALMRLNPMTSCHLAISRELGISQAPGSLPWALTLLFAAIGAGLAWATLGRGVRRL